MQIYYDDHLEHYGVGHLQGGHSGRYPWGSGKYTNPDGTLTEAGKKRYTRTVAGVTVLNKRGMRVASKATKRGQKIASSDRAKQVIESKKDELKLMYDEYREAVNNEYDMFYKYMDMAYIKLGPDSDIVDQTEWATKQPEYVKAKKNLMEIADKQFEILKDITNDVKMDSIGDFRFDPDDLSQYEREMNWKIVSRIYSN